MKINVNILERSSATYLKDRNKFTLVLNYFNYNIFIKNNGHYRGTSQRDSSNISNKKHLKQKRKY